MSKWFNYKIIVLLGLGIGLVGYVLLFKNNNESAQSPSSKKQERIVSKNRENVENSVIRNLSDHKMPGVLDEQTAYRVDENFYENNKIQRGDVVWVVMDPPATPMPRVVQGTPGDKFDLEQDSQNPKKWYILINGIRAHFNNEVYYFMYPGRVPLLKNRIEVEKGIIPPENYLLLSSKYPAKNDSSNFGLFHLNRIKGKVLEVSNYTQSD